MVTCDLAQVKCKQEMSSTKNWGLKSFSYMVGATLAVALVPPPTALSPLMGTLVEPSLAVALAP